MAASVEMTSPGALAQVKEDLFRFQLVPDLRESVRQHYEHLETLAANLRALGIDGATIDQHVVEIFAKYKAELQRSVERLKVDVTGDRWSAGR